MGSIMIEENVVASAGTSYRMSQDEMEHLITSAGYTPKQRTNLYERLVTRADTVEMARKYRHSLTPQNRDLVSSALLPVLG
jgi:2-iminoacetate synthase ThiH